MSALKKLVIVESPAKAKTIGKYLGPDYEVLASVGHIRDIPTPKELPADMKKGPFAQFAVDVQNGFTPYYAVSDNSKRTVADLKRALKEADELYLATDEDREGEAIAWHLFEVLKPKVPVHRMVFHEITKEAIEKARDNTREIDRSLVDAQETRRILDRLYGFEISPVMWRMVGRGLSAGRVQSPATRILVDRERERIAFVSAEYWDLLATVGTDSSATNQFHAKLVRLDGAKLASGNDFADNGSLKSSARVLTEVEAAALAASMRDSSTTVTVASLETKPYTRRPFAPFTTSTLQQEAVKKLKFSARQTMSVAQRLYENGYITYMRTDSPNLSVQAMNAARSQAIKLYGEDQVPEKPRLYAGKSKTAQEAHEAIRPAGDVFRTPDELSSVLRGEELRLYDLIWKRTVASQMADARGQTATVTIDVVAPAQPRAEFVASGTVITFRGFMNAYDETSDEDRNAQDAQEDSKLPIMTEGQTLVLAEVESKGHSTVPPPRYTEATLVKKMEEIGIGRPSTYSATIATILDRGYAVMKGQALVPTWIAFSVTRLMEQSFGDLVSYEFTSEMEDDLDKIANGEADWREWLRQFYFGHDEHPGLKESAENLGDIDKQSLNSYPVAEDVVVRIWPTNAYIEVDDPDAGPGEKRKVYLPDGMPPDELTLERAQELINAPVAGDRILGVNPENGKLVAAKDGRFGPYVTEIEPEVAEVAVVADTAVDALTGEIVEAAPKKKPAKAKAKMEAPKPRTASLFSSMDPSGIDLDTALKLLNLPRLVGHDPESGDAIFAANGRYGPYLKKGTDTRSLDSEDLIFTVDEPAALALFAQPKFGARRVASSIKEFGEDPNSGRPIKVKDGRFGPYVTDGETNATIPRGENPEEIEFDRAVVLLSERRAKGPAAPRATARKARTTSTTTRTIKAKKKS